MLAIPALRGKRQKYCPVGNLHVACQYCNMVGESLIIASGMSNSNAEVGVANSTVSFACCA